MARQKAWAELQPAFDIAIMHAKQAEYEAERASTIAMVGHEAAYSPLVAALAESVETPRAFDPWNPRSHQ
jgi:phosphohistidine phosphatase SixA